MRSEFCVHGPHELPFDSPGRGTSKRISYDHAKAFWARPELGQLGERNGCYVFALRVSGGFTPWYVGKTTKSFAQEALESHKLVHYNEVIYAGRKGLPVLYFVTAADPKAKIPPRQIDELETFLIQSAVYKNRELMNQKKAAIPEWGIRGVIRGGSGKAPDAARRFRAMMGL